MQATTDLPPGNRRMCVFVLHDCEIAEDKTLDCHFACRYLFLPTTMGLATKRGTASDAFIYPRREAP